MGFCYVKGLTMYFCFGCRRVFEVPSIETVQRAGEPSFDMESCPKCGSDFIFADYDPFDGEVCDDIEKTPPTPDDYEYYGGGEV